MEDLCKLSLLRPDEELVEHVKQLFHSDGNDDEDEKNESDGVRWRVNHGKLLGRNPRALPLLT